MANYVPYHVHTMLSNAVTNIDSVTTYKQYIEKAKECGMTAMAFSEHGNIFEWVHKTDAIEAAGMKYIHAMEAYLTERIPDEGEEKIHDNYHCVLIARNWEGVKELNVLQGKAFNRVDGHYYYAPRITFAELFSTSNNIIITTACVSSALCRGTESAKESYIRFLTRHKDRCFLEVQHHNTQKQFEYNRYLANLSRETGLRLIAGTDTHCLNAEHELGRSALQRGKGVFFDDEVGWDLTWKTYDELVEAYRTQDALSEEEYMSAINNTNVMADMIETFELDRSFKFPRIYENGEDLLNNKLFSEETIMSIVNEGFSRDEVIERLRMEVDTFKALDSIDYILLEDYIISYAHAHDMWQGPARGSAASSLALYALGTTEVNPLKYGFYFWRFMDKSKYSMPDIDVDFGQKDRDAIKEWMLAKHLDLPTIKTCEIITFNTIALKGAIRDIGRGLDMPLDEVDAIAKAVHEETVDENKVVTIDDSWRKKYPELFKYVDIVIGTIVSIGSHPSGVVVSDHDIASEFGLCYLKDDPYPVACINMKELDSTGWVKEDLLGLDNVTLINETCKLAGIERLSPKTIDFEDDAVWNSIKEDTSLIFQMNSNYGQRTVDRMLSPEVYNKIKKQIPNMTRLDLLTFINALIRPCGKGVYDDATNGIVSNTGIKEIDDLLGSSMGYAIMQEPQMAFVQEFCGYSFLESDKLRKCVARDSRVLMADGSLKNIEDVEVGEYVCTFDNYTCSSSKVVSKSDNGTKSVVKIKCDSGFNIRCTLDHKVLTQRGYVEAKDLTTRDFVFTPKTIKRHNDGIKSNKKPSNDTLWMLGALIGDGTIFSKECLAFTNSDAKIIEKFKMSVSQIGVKGVPEFSISVADGKTVDKVYSCKIKSSNFKDCVWGLLVRFDLNHKAAEKEIPIQIQRYSSTEKLAHFLAGMFNTDSGYNIGRQTIEYYSISKNLVYQLQAQLLKFGIYSQVGTKSVSGYDYNSYTLAIGDKESLRLFKDNILCYIVGEKYEELNSIVMLNNTGRYFVPDSCKKEFIQYCYDRNLSIRDVSLEKFGREIKVKNNYNLNIDDAKEMCSAVYMPETYAIVNSDFIMQRVISVCDDGEDNVYDIGVENTHNFIADGIVVHNCVAKKLGTRDQLPIIKEGWEKNAKVKYHLTDEQSDKIINPFLQCILDATRYSFSLVHSLSYSCISYECAYLRYHYPLQYLTSCLNAWNGDDNKTAEAIEYANSRKVKILAPKFRHAKAEYFYDLATNSIYKGTSSIKGLNAGYSDFLYSLKDNTYKTFTDLLYDIQASGMPRDQVETLIKLDYFEEFGTCRELATIFKQFQFFKKGEAKTIAKSKIPDEITMNIIKRNANETEKQFNKLNCHNILNEIEQYIMTMNLGDVDIKTKIANQLEYMGYIGIKTDKSEDRPKIVILEMKVMKQRESVEPWGVIIDAQSIGSGKRSSYTVPYKLYKKCKFNKNDVIKIRDWYKNKRGYFYITDYEFVVM